MRPCQLDHTVYPDREPPVDLSDPLERADYVHRICSALDFGIPPDIETLRLLATWKAEFDAFPQSSSAGYHALRSLFGWERFPAVPSLKEPLFVELDRLEGREDGCEQLV
jgi:hypothetical protein